MTPTIAKIVWTVCVIAWYVIRYPYERKAKRTAVARSRRDWREVTLLTISLSGLGIIPGAYVATGFGRVGDYAFSASRAWAGVAVFALSLWLFRRTHKDLGRNWSVSLEVRDGHRLVTEGVYRHVRHPMYTAFFLWAVAQALLLQNWIAGPAGLVGFGTLFVFRVFREEAMMLETFGEEYRAYARRTKRLVPWVF
ncbi:protein-S-isoprenylcysteine O-methyltransferase Ste14 [Tepidamorphus gemmatus]|uniref:Protein-S-isoprenylcysteine O-methyltransferase Ste14 n=1 Tax=Tepidamorphus gemmatus TaxID=747076 RepID=A0A4R3M280_9HYPH|nr:protein-S-isoprenylcysteine O-methyltransferase [Tepidamorphus gemmatus]TCT07271.1 protein-S-isoprenylcysteine O-methyltransferase Ste14 [Tepidamorphus gemmatus]